MPHSPAPFRADPFRDAILIRDANGKVIANVFMIWDDENNAKANQSLFLAAPEMLAACEEIMEFLSNGTPINPGAFVQASVFNAIAKAKGEQS